MYQLTNREKKLLCFLACLMVFLIALYVFIKPASTQYSRLRTEYDDTKLTEMLMRTTNQDEKGINGRLETVRAAIAKESRTFYAPMASEDADELITTFLDQNGLVNRSLDVTVSQPVEIGVFQPEVNELIYPYRDHLIAAGEPLGPSEQEQEEYESAIVLRSSLTLQMVCETDQAVTFIDDLSREKPIQVTSFVMTGTESGQTKFNISFDVYMLHHVLA